MPYTYKTGLAFTLSDAMEADQHSVDLTIRYTVNKGRAATLEEPGEGPSVSIKSADLLHGHGFGRTKEAAPAWLWPFLETDEALAAELLAHAAECDDYAREQAADARREEARL